MSRAQPTKRRRLTHTADVWLPPADLDARGQRTGEATLVASGVPCSVESLTGRELEQARQTYALSTHRVTVLGSVAWRLTPEHYLQVSGRRHNIGYVEDVDGKGFELRLLVGEEA